MNGFGKAIVMVALLAAGQAQAAERCRGPEGLPDPQGERPLVPYEFHRTANKGLGCVLPPESGGRAKKPKGVAFLACLKIGPVAIGDSMTQVEEVLDVPDRITTLDDSVEQRAYFVRQRVQPLPYFVVTYLNGAVVALQLVGPPTEMPLAFSSLSLGDPQQKVIDVLGRPARRCPNVTRGFDTWHWPPYPFAVDVADGKVVGLKTSVPVEKDR
jgi:hypothetical protein